MKKVIAISGSPRNKGTTDTLLTHFVHILKEKGAEVELFSISRMAISPCTECGGCNDTGVCTIIDGMAILYERLKEVDVIVISTPVFFSSVPAQLKSFIDRFQSWWMAKEKLGKKIRENTGKLAILVAGGRKSEKDFECVRRTMIAFGMTTDLAFTGGLYFPNTESPEDLPSGREIYEKLLPLVYKLMN